MRLYLVRHADAEPRDSERWPDDGERPLAARGRKQFRRAARVLRKAVSPADATLSSGLVRAWQTARLLHKEAAWATPIRLAALEQTLPPADLAHELASCVGPGGAQALAVVGHEPSMSALVSHFLCGDAGRIEVRMTPGAIACLDFAGDLHAGAGTLRWLAGPRLLRGR